jgi:hypothetical protein
MIERPSHSGVDVKKSKLGGAGESFGHSSWSQSVGDDLLRWLAIYRSLLLLPTPPDSAILSRDRIKAQMRSKGAQLCHLSRLAISTCIIPSHVMSSSCFRCKPYYHVFVLHYILSLYSTSIRYIYISHLLTQSFSGPSIVCVIMTLRSNLWSPFEENPGYRQH